MKKTLALALFLALVLTVSIACAGDLGVQVIGGPDAALTPMSLDDMQVGNVYTIDGYAKVKPVEFAFVDHFAQFNKDANYANLFHRKDATTGHVFVAFTDNSWYNSWRWAEAAWMDSGLNAEFAWLMIDVTNLQKKGVSFMENASVKVVYQDEYEFAGWVRQINYDHITPDSPARAIGRYGVETTHPNVVVLDPANEEAIDMMYTGTYVFGATLPNSVVEDTKSTLQLIITLDGNELIYNIRK